MDEQKLFDITLVRLQGDTRFITLKNMQATISQELNGNLFSVDLHQVRQIILLMPWIKDVSIRRVWPNQLVVNIKAYHPVAIWRRTGQLLSDNAELFMANPAETDRHLPILEGPIGTEKQVLSQYQFFSTWFAEIGMFPESVRLSSRYAWSLSLSNGTFIELGRQTSQNILYERSIRMIKAWPMIVRIFGSRVDYVDLRYSNGLAISSKKKAF